MDLPTLDFSLFTQGSLQERKNTARALVSSFKNHGFVKLTNHGLPEDVVKAYMKAVSATTGHLMGSQPNVAMLTIKGCRLFRALNRRENEDFQPSRSEPATRI